MKRLVICIFILAALGIFLSACKVDNSRMKFSDSVQGTTNTNLPSTSDNSNYKEEVFYGNWIINSCIKTNHISTYGEEDIKKLIGKKIVYGSKVAKFDKVTLKGPCYKKSIISKKEFFEDNNINFERLGIKGESTTAIDVYTDREYKNFWESIGKMFLIKDENTLILIDEGESFELVRVGSKE